jgi:phosphohistidine phosphatase
VPYRFRGGRPEFCLITASSKPTWGFPKGIIDPGETPEQTALKEALEEAGLHGRIVGEPLGGYEYRKWGAVLTVTAYLLEVAVADDDWEEAWLRERAWRRPEEARAVVHRDEHRTLIDAALERIKSTTP